MNNSSPILQCWKKVQAIPLFAYVSPLKAISSIEFYKIYIAMSLSFCTYH